LVTAENFSKNYTKLFSNGKFRNGIKNLLLLSYFDGVDKFRYGALNDEAFGYFKRVIVTPAV
jgi:hypothetical protein